MMIGTGFKIIQYVLGGAGGSGEVIRVMSLSFYFLYIFMFEIFHKKNDF